MAKIIDFGLSAGAPVEGQGPAEGFRTLFGALLGSLQHEPAPPQTHTAKSIKERQGASRSIKGILTGCPVGANRRVVAVGEGKASGAKQLKLTDADMMK